MDPGERPSDGNRSREWSPGPWWRAPLDAIQGPATELTDAWIQSDVYMDALAFSVRLQRRLRGPLERIAEDWMGLWRLPTRGDVVRVSNQLGDLEREVRRLAAALEASTASNGARPRGTGSPQRTQSRGGAR
jgi:hypothetical protein